MTSNRIVYGILHVLASILLSAAGASAIEVGEAESNAGVKVGILGRGTVELEGQEFDTDQSISFGAFFDYRVLGPLQLGLSVDFHHQNWVIDDRRYTENVKGMVVDLGLNLKALLASEGSQAAIRPGIGIGFAPLEAMEIVRGSSHMVGRATIEVLISPDTEIGGLFELGVWRTLRGSDDLQDVNVGPLVFARVGLVF